MHNVHELSDEECGHLARILLASRRVSLRHHFFSWVHGPLQSLIPHEILLCGVADESGFLLHERFTACRYFRDDHYHRVIHPGSGLIQQLSQEWQLRSEPHLIAALPNETGGWHARLADLELKNIAFHAMGWLSGQLKGYASFSRVRAPFDERRSLHVADELPLGARAHVHDHRGAFLEKLVACRAAIEAPIHDQVAEFVRENVPADAAGAVQKS